MEKQKLKHLAPYLPYGLKIKGNTNGDVEILSMLSDTSVNIKGRGTSYGMWAEIADVKPILRPLSYLTKEIEHNGEKFVPYKYLKENYLSYNKYNYNWFKNKTNLVNIKILPYDIIQKLLEWHFDVYNLIPQNLAIDINTLEK